MAFKIGQRVVCVHGCRATGPWPALAKNAIYTIREIYEWHGHVGVSLKEVVCEEYSDGSEHGYHVWRFRPIVDISDLTSIVTEVFNDRPRTIAPDKFDKQRIHSAAVPPNARQHDAGAMPAAGSGSLPEPAPNSPPPNSGGHAGCPSKLRDDRVVAGVSIAQAIIPCRQSPARATE